MAEAEVDAEENGDVEGAEKPEPASEYAGLMGEPVAVCVDIFEADVVGWKMRLKAAFATEAMGAEGIVKYYLKKGKDGHRWACFRMESSMYWISLGDGRVNLPPR